jgi:2-keto-4-pentenoate hydratase/2-oxohepta-3-ene-1,7-dioic acid hydratase in catechol pathway
MRRIVRYQASGSVRWGEQQGNQVRELASGLFEPPRFSGVVHDLTGVRPLAPLAPGKIVGIGRNYRDHAREMGGEAPPWPDIFLKPPSAVIGPDEAIELPAASTRVEIEAELGVVVGKRLHDATPSEAAEAVFGLTVINDVTARDLQRSDRTWARAKGFDTFAPLGPCIATGLDWSNLLIEAFVNGECKQSARTSDMIHGVPALLAYVSGVMTLLPGDVVATGTPAGVSPIVAGDVVEIEIEGIGRLRNPVVARPQRDVDR